MLTDEDIIWGYRLFLDRDPESQGVLTAFKGLESYKDMRWAFLTSREYHLKNLIPYLPLDLPPNYVEWRADPATAERIAARVAATWTRLGRERPHWSVLASDEFLPERIDGGLDAFFASGEHDVALLLGTLGRLGANPSHFPRVFEFGCGVGRVTPHLARRFAEVTACDISCTHLEQARQRLAGAAIDVRLGLAGFPKFGMGEPFDIWFSRIVLQHNPPPLIAVILRRALQMLTPGGLAVFQIPTYAVGYSFRISDYLRNTSHPGPYEMHVLPQAAIFEIAEECGCLPCEVREENSAGTPNWISNWIVLRKSAGSGLAAEPVFRR